MCCGASRAIGRLPQAAILLGEDDGGAATYVRVIDGTLIPGVSTGAQIYIKGTSVEQAIEGGMLQDVGAAAVQRNSGKRTIFRVRIPGEDEPHDFPAFATARTYAIRNGGKLEVVTE